MTPRHLLTIVITLSASALPFSVLGQSESNDTENTGRKPNTRQQGSIGIEENKKDFVPYLSLQDSVISFITELQKRVAALSRGEPATPVAPPSDAVLNFLTAVYLDCSIKNGTCISILQSVFEYDFTNARQSKTHECPAMIKFWKLWLNGDLEKRQKYLVRTAYINATSEFNKKVRPQYVKCAQTITEQTAGSESDTVFFKNRYKTNAEIKDGIDEALKTLLDIKSNIPNIFSANGIKRLEQ